MEEWRDVPGYEGRYQVSNLGNLRALDRYVGGPHGPRLCKGQKLIPWVKDDYYTVVRFGRSKRSHKVHHLVLEAFVGPRPSGCLALHRDDDKANNRLSNLYYGTRHDNNLDAVRNGKQRPGISLGEKHGHAKLKEADIPKILALASGGIPLLRIAQYFGVTDMTIHDVVKGKTWSWLTKIGST